MKVILIIVLLVAIIYGCYICKSIFECLKRNNRIVNNIVLGKEYYSHTDTTLSDHLSQLNKIDYNDTFNYREDFINILKSKSTNKFIYTEKISLLQRHYVNNKDLIHDDKIKLILISNIIILAIVLVNIL